MSKSNKKVVAISLSTLLAVVTIAGAGYGIYSIMKKISKPTAEDIQNVQTLNESLSKLSTTFPTYTHLINYLYADTGIYLPDLRTKNNNAEYIWDQENNVIFLMKTNGDIFYWPDGYQGNMNKSCLWKMVKSNEPKTNNDTDIYCSIFDSTTGYSQYLRDGYEFGTGTSKDQIEIKSGLDMGNISHKVVTLSQQAIGSTPTCVRTNQTHLIIENAQTAVHHYGHATKLEIKKINPDKSYDEFGWVDGNVEIDSGRINVRPDSNINTIVINGNSVIIELIPKEKQYPIVGTVATKEGSQAVQEPWEYVQSWTDIPSTSRPTTVKNLKINTDFSGGLGTMESPFTIENVTQLAFCANYVERTTLEEGKFHFALSSDIEAKGIELSPIGTKSKPYYGTFDGHGFTISNLLLKDVDSGYCGLFGYVTGEANDSYKINLKPTESETYIDNLWDSENMKLKTENFNESKYSTIIKNINISNINIDSEKNSYIGAFVGKGENAYLSNLHVLSGTINAKSNSGGIIGAASGCVIDTCSAGAERIVTSKNELSINGFQHNIGGIVGHPARAYEDTRIDTCGSAIINCANYADVTVTCGTTQPEPGKHPSPDPGVGGIVGNTTNSNKKYKPTVIENCDNYGNIKVVGEEGKDYTQATPAGICSNAQSVYVISNCNNYGNISNDGKHLTVSMAGITCKNSAIVNKCTNYGEIKGYGLKVAGICAEHYNDSQAWTTEFIDIKNDPNAIVETTAKDVGGVESDYILGTTDLVVTGEFANYEKLIEQISGKNNVFLKDVTILDKGGQFVLPNSIHTIISNKEICTSIKLGDNPEFTNISIELPNADVIIDSDYSSKNLVVNSSYVNEGQHVSVTDQGKIGALTISGKNSEVINNGNIRTLNIVNQAVKAENTANGKIGNVTFDAADRASQDGNPNKHLINKGTISSTNAHTLYTQSLVAVNPTIDNYGTIKSDPTASAVYIFLWYSPGTFTINNLESGIVETTQASGGIIAMSSLAEFNINFKSTSKLIQNGNEKSWYDFGSDNVHVKEI